MNTLTNLFNARRRRSRIKAEMDALIEVRDRTTEQLDALAAELESNAVALALLELDREVLPTVPVRMEMI